MQLLTCYDSGVLNYTLHSVLLKERVLFGGSYEGRKGTLHVQFDGHDTVNNLAAHL